MADNRGKIHHPSYPSVSLSLLWAICEYFCASCTEINFLFPPTPSVILDDHYSVACWLQLSIHAIATRAKVAGHAWVMITGTWPVSVQTMLVVWPAKTSVSLCACHSMGVKLIQTMSAIAVFSLTPSLRRPYIHAILFWPLVGQRVNTHSVFWEFCRKPCQHATHGCDKRWMTCIHAGVSRSPREHASVPPDKRHCRQWMSSLFCGFLHNPFIHDLFCWSSRPKFVKNGFIIHCLWCLSGTPSVRPGAGW